MSKGTYQCMRPCFFGGKLWEIGERTTFEDGKWPKGKDGEIRHFERVDRPEPEAPIEADKPENKDGGVAADKESSNINLSDEDRVFPQKRSPKPKKAK